MNLGEWREVSVRTHALVHGKFLDGLKGGYLEFDDVIIGKKIFPKMSTAKPGYYQISIKEAEAEQAEFVKSLDNVKGSRASFDVPVARKLCANLGIPCAKAGSHEKEDIVVRLKRDKPSTDQAFFVEATDTSRASFVNASAITHISYKVRRKDGQPLVSEDRQFLLSTYGAANLGNQGVKVVVQDCIKRGYVFVYSHIKHEGFRGRMDTIGPAEMACLCMDYLSAHGCAKLTSVLELHKQHHPEKFSGFRKRLLDYIRQSIQFGSPTESLDDKNPDYPNCGMVFVGRHWPTAIPANGEGWWQHKIEKSAAFDTPDSTKHDFGYVYETTEGTLQFDYSLGIRGSFRAFRPGIEPELPLVYGA